MGFLSPWFFAGLAGLALPVYLHLLRRHRTTPFRFSSLMFFERRTESSIQHRRLMYLLLLALRLAVLLLVVLAFANPYIRRAGVSASTRKTTVVAIDNSFSMRQGGRLEQAKTEALNLLARKGAGDRAQVVAVGSSVRLMSEATADLEQLRAAVHAVEASDSHGSFAELARTLRVLTQTSQTPVEAHLFSDLQRSSMPPVFADVQLGPGVSLQAHPIGGATANWTVETVTAPRRITGAKRARVEAIVASYAPDAAQKNVSLAVNGKVLETKNVALEPGGRARVEFASVDAPYGFSRAEIRIEPADPFPADDRFYFTVERSDPKRILLVRNAGNSRAELYYRAAIDAAAEAGFAIDPTSGDLSPSKYALAVLSDPGALSPEFERELTNYVKAGGAVFVALGPATAARGRVPVSGERIVSARYAARSGERFFTAGQVDAAHPSIRKSNNFEGVKFYQAVEIDPGSSRVVARFAGGSPLLTETALGEGRVLVFASTLDNVSNDFPLHASFVPFVEQTAVYLSGQEDRPARLPVDAFMELRSSRDRGTSVEVLDPAGARALKLSESASAETFQVTRQGFYEVRRANGRQEVIAVNTDRRESDLQPIPSETLALWRNTGDVSAPAGAGQPASQGEQQRREPLWWYALAAALTIAAAESLVGRKYLEPRSESRPLPQSASNEVPV
jgi:hypothetical protein